MLTAQAAGCELGKSLPAVMHGTLGPRNQGLAGRSHKWAGGGRVAGAAESKSPGAGSGRGVATHVPHTGDLAGSSLGRTDPEQAPPL